MPYELIYGNKTSLPYRPDVDAVWTNAHASILGEWSLDNGTESMRTELYTDMRRPDVGTWLPDTEVIVETLNHTGFGCLELTANGLYGMKLLDECQEELRPSCEYTGIVHGLYIRITCV